MRNATLSRRRFLRGSAVAATAAVSAPNVVKAQGPINMRWQSTWPSRDIFHEYAVDFAMKVNDMTGGELKIEVLPSGSVVPAFALLDAVSKGSLDGGHGVVNYHYRRHSGLGLWGSGPAYGMDGNMLLAWHKYGGGRELIAKLYKTLGANVVSFPYGPMPTQPLGWFRKRIERPEDFNGMKFRTVGIAIDMYTALGATVTPMSASETVVALGRGVLDAAENNNVTSDRIIGFPQVASVYMLQSFHQNSEQFEILFNKTRFDSLPDKLRSIIENAVEAASADMSWKAIDRYSKDYEVLRDKGTVAVHKTPDAVLKRQIELFDQAAQKKASENPLFKEIIDSQIAFARRATRWEHDTVVDRKLAFEHYFGPSGVAKKM